MVSAITSLASTVVHYHWHQKSSTRVTLTVSESYGFHRFHRNRSRSSTAGPVFRHHLHLQLFSSAVSWVLVLGRESVERLPSIIIPRRNSRTNVGFQNPPEHFGTQESPQDSPDQKWPCLKNKSPSLSHGCLASLCRREFLQKAQSLP